MASVGAMSSSTQALHGAFKVSRQPVRHARTAKAREAERTHWCDLIQRHHALRVLGAPGASLGLAGIAATALVGSHHGEVRRQRAGQAVPD